MARRYSIAEARQLFTHLVREAESGRSFEITRRGRAVAVIVSASEYARLAEARPSFAEAVDSFRESMASDERLTAADFRSLRSREGGRDVEL